MPGRLVELSRTASVIHRRNKRHFVSPMFSNGSTASRMMLVPDDVAFCDSCHAKADPVDDENAEHQASVRLPALRSVSRRHATELWMALPQTASRRFDVSRVCSVVVHSFASGRRPDVAVRRRQRAVPSDRGVARAGRAIGVAFPSAASSASAKSPRTFGSASPGVGPGARWNAASIAGGTATPHGAQRGGVARQPLTEHLERAPPAEGRPPARHELGEHTPQL